MQHVLGLEREVDLAVDRDVQLARGDLLAVAARRRRSRRTARRRRAPPSAGLSAASTSSRTTKAYVHRPTRRSRGSRSRSPRGACCRGSAARRGPPRPGASGTSDREQHDHRDPDEHRDREDDQDVPQRVDRLRLFGGGEREPVDQRPAAMPRIDATTPMPSICSSRRERAGARAPGVLSLSSRPMGRHPMSARTNASPAVAWRQTSGGAVRRTGAERPRAVERAVGARPLRGNRTVRRPGSAGTPWRTGPAGGSRRGARPRARSARAWSISAAFCMRTRVRWSGTSSRRSRRTHAGVATRGRDTARDVVEREIGGVLPIDDLGGLLKQRGAQANG